MSKVIKPGNSSWGRAPQRENSAHAGTAPRGKPRLICWSSRAYVEKPFQKPPNGTLQTSPAASTEIKLFETKNQTAFAARSTNTPPARRKCRCPCEFRWKPSLSRRRVNVAPRICRCRTGSEQRRGFIAIRSPFRFHPRRHGGSPHGRHGQPEQSRARRSRIFLQQHRRIRRRPPSGVSHALN